MVAHIDPLLLLCFFILIILLSFLLYHHNGNHLTSYLLQGCASVHQCESAKGAKDLQG
jgi:hypothetical protein